VEVCARAFRSASPLSLLHACMMGISGSDSNANSCGSTWQHFVGKNPIVFGCLL